MSQQGPMGAHKSLAAFYDGIGRSNYHSWTGEARIRIKW
jgi:hypothetical protein